MRFAYPGLAKMGGATFANASGEGPVLCPGHRLLCGGGRLWRRLHLGRGLQPGGGHCVGRHFLGPLWELHLLHRLRAPRLTTRAVFALRTRGMCQ